MLAPPPPWSGPPLATAGLPRAAALRGARARRADGRAGQQRDDPVAARARRGARRWAPTTGRSTGPPWRGRCAAPSEAADAAVRRPVEGTMLTVARRAAERPRRRGAARPRDACWPRRWRRAARGRGDHRAAGGAARGGRRRQRRAGRADPARGARRRASRAARWPRAVREAGAAAGGARPSALALPLLHELPGGGRRRSTSTPSRTPSRRWATACW